MKGWPEFTIGQLLDKRKACSSNEWESFTDTHGRKIVQYTCTNQVAMQFVHALYNHAIDDKRHMQQSFLKRAEQDLNNAQESLQRAQADYEKQGALVAQMGNNDSGDKEILLGDFALIQNLRQESCGKTDKRNFRVPRVIEILEKMDTVCQQIHRRMEACPDTLKKNKVEWEVCILSNRFTKATPASVVGNAISEVKQLVDQAEKAEGRSNQRLDDARFSLGKREEWVKRAEGALEEARSALEAAPSSNAIKELEVSIERHKKGLEDFKEIRETMQWAIQDGQAVYVGAKIDLIDASGNFEMPLEAEYVFSHAAKDSDSFEEMRPAYLTLIRRMWEQRPLPKL